MQPLWQSLYHFLDQPLHHTRKINLTLVCREFIIRFVMGCLELSRNDSGSYPFDPSIRYCIAKLFQRRFWLFQLEGSISLFIHFFNCVFERLEHFVNHFWFWWNVIQQPITKILNLLHTLSNEIFYILLAFYREIWWSPRCGCKIGVGSFGICS